VVAGEIFARWLRLTPEELEAARPHFSLRSGAAAGRHVLRVAAGLESAVVGEDQILGQVRNAYRSASTAREVGPLLHRLFHAALRAGKRARAETDLGRGSHSLAGAGVAFLTRSLGGLTGRAVLVLGAGEMGSAAAMRLRERQVGRLIVSSRNRERTGALAARVEAEALPWEWRRSALSQVEGVICATGAPEPVVPAAWLEEAAKLGGRTLAVVDLAVPRNVEPPTREIASVRLADVDVLSRDLAQDARRRSSAIQAAEQIVEEELQEWLAWTGARDGGARAVGEAHCPRIVG
jgi:glutamyl-tRNA reductase